MKQLQYYLERLQPNEYIVLHGMKGFGKSSLTASTLKDCKCIKSIFYVSCVVLENCECNFHL